MPLGIGLQYNINWRWKLAFCDLLARVKDIINIEKT